MESKIVEGQERCCIDIRPKCTGADCVLFVTFTDQRKGLCAFQIGRAAVRIVPGIVNELSGVLKNELIRKQLSESIKKLVSSLSILIFFLGICQFAFSDNDRDTWENNRIYIADKLDTLVQEIKGLRKDLLAQTLNTSRLEGVLLSQEGKVLALEKSINYLQESIKYLYGLLILSVGGNAISGGALWKQAKAAKNNSNNRT